MSDLIKALGKNEYQKLKDEIQRVVRSAGHERLAVSGQAEIDVVYRVEARVTLDLRDIELDNVTKVYTSIEGDLSAPTGIRIYAADLPRSLVLQDVIDDAVYEKAGEEIPYDLDDYTVEIMEAVVDDYDVSSFELDPESETLIEEWNSRVEADEKTED